MSVTASAFDWQVDITPGGNLFPALDLSLPRHRAASRQLDGNGLVAVRFRSADRPNAFRLTIDTPGLREAAVIEVNSGSDAPAATTLVLKPRLDWNVAELRRLRDVRSQVLTAALEGPGFARSTRHIEVRLHPLDDALYFVREGGDQVDLSWAFAAYVDPRDPVVDEVLRLARDVDPAFDTRSGDDDQARNLRRAGAIWAALERHGLRYADAQPALSRGPVVWSQRVRLPDETWRERGANCLDSSVLLASVLERIGMSPFLVLTPGHAFVGFQVGPDSERAIYLETTLLGASRSAASDFEAARRAGSAQFRRIARKLDGRHGPDYALIDIGSARAYGIIPLTAGERASRNPATVEPAPAEPSQQSGSP